MKGITLKGSVLIFLLGIISILTLSTCKKDEPKVNIVLYDKPLDVIKSYIQGKWWLEKVTGGICTTCGAPVKNNPYMITTDDHIVLGNNTGVRVDTIIVWQKIRYYYGYGNDSTYLLSYRAQKYYAFPINYIVDRIENNNLILIDYASDPFSYYYIK